MDTSSFLMVERGVPFAEGNMFSLKQSLLILGRRGSGWEPDISFQNVFISRRHAAIYYKNGSYFIKDLESKHGTFLNDTQLLPNKGIMLKHNDRISLASGQIILSFMSQNIDETLELAPIKIHEENGSQDLRFNAIKQEITVQNETYSFSEKEYKCLELLLQKKDQFVSKEELKKWVWSERIHIEGSSDVSPEELNALMYRIRKKTSGVLMIENIRGKGYIVSVNM
ncbi:FHA domain-containing protein [Ectobacillus antri]|jgi:two-component system response regulator QseB|uniref:FHA domain-containing protein n=1 Tax=Ectobacillus antri TaxID=2486280 RepID=A0ABT6H6N6_9BACI|nr:FHA domain-containing protein [Ectobacillus antri]MDG4657264.1 FHA domain-containing protein [Ectobacillus antri]MDG5754384.1 FHA domain-containing protein [Ectobacillus antri]